MSKVSYENTCGLADLITYTRLMQEDNREQLGRLKRNLIFALQQDVTPRQREYLAMYYLEGRRIEEIAQLKGVNKSTVSRTMKRGRQRLSRCLRYGASNLLEQAES